MQSDTYVALGEIRISAERVADEIADLREEMQVIVGALRQLVALQAVNAAKPETQEEFERIFQRFGAALENKK